MSALDLECDDDALDDLSNVDVDAIAREALENRRKSAEAAPSSAHEWIQNSIASTSRARQRPHVWMEFVSPTTARVSCSHERLRAGFAGKLYAAVDFGCVAPATPDDGDAGAAWDVPMRAVKCVRDALCAMDAFEKVYSSCARRSVLRGAPPAQTVEYASHPPGYCGRRKKGGAADEGEAARDVDARFERIAANIRAALYPFQVEGVKFAIRRNGRALIADQMGVGKTLQAIAVADAYRDAGPLLVIVPAAMRFVWADEIERWLTDVTPRQLSVIFGSGDKYMLEKLARESRDETSASGRRVVVSSYHMLAPLLEEFMSVKWGCVIADESHNMHVSKNFKAPETKMTETAVQLIKRAKYAVLTTGTPSLTKPFDMFHQIDALRPGMLGQSKWDFAEHYCDVKFDLKGRSDVSGGSRLLELRSLLTHTTMIRRLKRDVMGDLPPKRRQVVPIDIDQSISHVGGPKIWSKLARVARQPRDEASYEDEERNVMDEDDESAGDVEYELKAKLFDLERGNRVSVSQLVGMLKIAPIIEWLESDLLRDDTMQFVVFAHHQAVLDAIERDVCMKLRNQNRGSYVRIDGSTPSDERKILVDKFREGAALNDEGIVGVRIALLSVKAAGTGLDFSTASCVVFAELPDDASLLEQAEARVHRRGNDSGVNVYFLCARGGACSHDEDRWQRLESQLDVCKEAIDGDDAKVGLDVEAYGSSIALKSTMKSAFSKKVVDAAAGVEESSMDAPSAPRLPSERTQEVENFPLWFEVSAMSGRLHLHASADGDKPLRVSVSRSQLVRALASEKYMRELPEPFASDPIAVAAALDFSTTWNAMTARDRNAILARQQPCRARELNGLAEELNFKGSTAATGSMTRHGRLVPLPKDADWHTVVVTEISRRNRDYEMRVPYRYAPGSDRKVLLCVNCVGELNRITSDTLRRVDLFCGEECLKAYDQGMSASSLRRALYERERGICVQCNLDCEMLVRNVRLHKSRTKRIEEILRLAPAFSVHGNKSLLNRLAEKPSSGRAWECDHKVAVYEGGGACTIENAQTLCVICHSKKTKAQAKERAAKRKRDAEIAEARRNRPIARLEDSDTDADVVATDDLLPSTTKRAPASRVDPPKRTTSDSEDDAVDLDEDLRPVFAARPR